MFHFNPFPQIITSSLLLRRMNEDDAKDLFEMRKDPRMNEYTDTKPDLSIDETIAYMHKMNKGIDDNRWIIWAIEHKETAKVIGSVSIWNISSDRKSAELGYGIIPDYQGKGLMKEALSSVLEFGFETMNLEILEAYTEENNLKSNKLLKALNFTEKGRADEVGQLSDKVYHMIIYRLDKQQD